MTGKILRFTSVMMVVISLVCSFSACGEDKPGNSNTGYISGYYQMIIDSADKINCDYLLVYRNNASYAEIDAFVDFLERLSASSSATFQICPDTLNIDDSNQKLILLGSTTYSESEMTSSIMKSIRNNNNYDYLIRGYGNTLSVMWMSKYGREDAFNYIIEKLLTDGFKD